MQHVTFVNCLILKNMSHVNQCFMKVKEILLRTKSLAGGLIPSNKILLKRITTGKKHLCHWTKFKSNTNKQVSGFFHVEEQA